MRNMTFGALLASAGLAGAAMLAAPAAAQQRSQTFDIPAQPAADALNEWARQAGRQIVFPFDAVSGRRTPAVKGNLTPRQALERLTVPLGLSIDESGETVRLAPLGRASAEPSDLPGDEVEEIVVTGSNIRNVDIAAPAIVIGRREFAAAGFDTLENVLAAVPQNFNAISPSGSISQEGSSTIGIVNRNTDKAVGIDLRGLGAESTLTLLNGSRRAGAVAGMVVDLSAIPLAAVERVEIVTGGRSAVYGSDAIAGVVNIVTRHDFDGAETTLSYGLGQNGHERAQASQVVGFQSDRAGFVAAIDYVDEEAFDLVRADLTRPTQQGAVPVRREALPDTTRLSAFAAGHWDAADNLVLRMDTLYSRQRNESHNWDQYPTAARLSTNDDRNVNEQFAIGGSVDLDLGSSWLVTAKGGYSQSVSDGHTRLFTDRGTSTSSLERDRAQEFRLKTLSLVATGDLPTMAGITPSVALGIEGRWEDFKSTETGNIDRTNKRDVKSAFAELVLPLFERDGRDPLIELSAAGRFDDYSDFGSVFNPQAGIVFKPAPGLKLSAAYSESFRAPALVDLGNTNYIFIINVPDPTIGGADRPVLRISGDDPDLQPETATTWSVTASYQPPASRRTLFEISYYSVDYRNRIGFPIFGIPDAQLLAREAQFANIIDRSPTAEQIAGFVANAPFGVFNVTDRAWDPATQAILDVFPDILLLDSRTTNSAVEKVRGIDFRARTGFATSIGEIGLGINGSYTLDHDRKATIASPAFRQYNEVGRPVDLRLRGEASWTSAHFAANLFVNYTDSYANPFSTPPGRISSWTTFDLNLRVNGSALGDSDILRNSSVSLTVRNLFDARPPLFPDGAGAGILYDPANANPFGRIVTARLSLRY